MRLSAGDCLRRGSRSLRVEWRLVPLLLLRSLVTLPLVTFGALLPLRAGGIDLSALGATFARDPEAAQAQVDGFVATLAAGSPAILGAVLAMLGLWTAAVVLYCYVEAGLYGVLVAADAAIVSSTFDGEAMREAAVSPRRFHALAMRYFARFFWFLNLAWAIYALPLLVFLLLLLPVLAAAMRWGAGAALGLGCCGALLSGALGAAAFGWGSLAQADLARPGSNVRIACRRGFAILAARPGAVALLVVLFFLLLAVSVPPLALLALVAQAATAGVTGLSAVASVAALALQSLPEAILSVLFGAAFVALVRSESRGETDDLLEALPA